MALLRIDGFDNYWYWTDLHNTFWNVDNSSFVSTGYYGRYGTRGVQIDHPYGVVRAQLPEDISTVYAGIAMYNEDTEYSPTTADGPIYFRDEYNRNQIRCCIDSDWSFKVYRNTDLLGSSASGITGPLTWFYLEMKVVISATVGEVIVRVNEEVIINLTGINTKAYTDYIRWVALNALGNNLTMYFDDFYADDSKFHGDCRVRTYLPNSNGTYTDFAPSAGTNYQNVNATYADEDATYNEASNLGDKDSYGVTASLNGPVVGLQVQNYLKKSGTIPVKIKNLVRSGGSDYLGDEKTLNTVYEYKSTVFENNPATSSAWNEATINAAEFGVEVTSLSTTTTTTSTTSTTTTTV